MIIMFEIRKVKNDTNFSIGEIYEFTKFYEK